MTEFNKNGNNKTYLWVNGKLVEGEITGINEDGYFEVSYDGVSYERSQERLDKANFDFLKNPLLAFEDFYDKHIQAFAS